MTIRETLQNGKNGLLYGNRLVLPFKARFLTVVIENEIITDFSHASKHVALVEEDNYTSIYFFKYQSLRNTLAKYEGIKLLVVEKEDDIFDLSKHKKLMVYRTETHTATIEETDQDILFIE
ncbi:MAG: hypothetical protein LC102_00760 [Ignavibacteriales bacterium]|nr:MAG: hypothetical protein F9K26_03520 [Ignavibacteriaceae bacterium]MBW7872503.1 hypothetical protein [Ignavibacteria bacterium]MCZ2141944.1 hypothetical protein [Ignavibacteriales bacterium]MBV6445110.1 hypothetical protein [Ignavibacteriaceae bacterium]MBZ0197625.1 hypothetical protein [Ignavibacteriaceae bacterium]